MNDESPRRRSLDSLKKEAKRWLDALHGNDPEAVRRLRQTFPDAPAAPSLRDVQHALAREHGFGGWSALKQSVEETIEANRQAGVDALRRYDAMARALLDAYLTGTPEAMERLYQFTWHRRTWQTMRTYVQLDLGKRPTNAGDEVAITLDDARHLVALEHGFTSWADLQAFTRSPKAAGRMAAKPIWIVAPDASDSGPLASTRDWDEVIELLASQPSAGLRAHGQMTDAVLADLSRVETLTMLDLSGCRQVTDEGVRHLARQTALQHLDLSGTNVTDAGLQALRSLGRLRTISLAWTNVTDAGVRHLAGCHELEDVNLAATGAGDGSLRALAGKNRLHRLSIALTDDGLPLLHELPVFKSWHGGDARLALLGPKVLPNHLSIRGSITDRGMRQMRGLDGLFSLDIDDSRLAITGAALEPLVSLPRLAALGVDAKDDWMPYVAALPHLRFIGAQDTAAGDDGFEALSRSKSIEYIWGRRCHNLRRRGFTALARMPALLGLSVSCLNVDDAGVAALPSFPALRELMPMDVPDAGYRHIGRCERLESLILMYCRDTTDAATEHIVSLDNLRNYFNSYTTITDRTPELLSAMDSLEQVTFDACHLLSNAGVSRLARLPNLRELSVAGNGITADVVRAFPPRVRVHYQP